MGILDLRHEDMCKACQVVENIKWDIEHPWIFTVSWDCTNLTAMNLPQAMVLVLRALKHARDRGREQRIVVNLFQQWWNDDEEEEDA